MINSYMVAFFISVVCVATAVLLYIFVFRDTDDDNTECTKPGFHLDSSGNCVQNTCICGKGNSAIGVACTKDRGYICSSCNKGYHLKNDICVQNTCTCQNGVPAMESECTTDGGNICSSCYVDFKKENSQCIDFCSSAKVIQKSKDFYGANLPVYAKKIENPAMDYVNGDRRCTYDITFGDCNGVGDPVEKCNSVSTYNMEDVTGKIRITYDGASEDIKSMSRID